MFYLGHVHQIYFVSRLFSRPKAVYHESKRLRLKKMGLTCSRCFGLGPTAEDLNTFEQLNAPLVASESFCQLQVIRNIAKTTFTFTHIL